MATAAVAIGTVAVTTAVVATGGASGSVARRGAWLMWGLLAWAVPAGAQESIEIVASKAGFKPALVKLRKGEPVKLLLKTADVDHCFAVDALRVEKRVPAGKTTTLELTPDRAGELPFYCCLEPDNAAQKGKLVVAE